MVPRIGPFIVQYITWRWHCAWCHDPNRTLETGTLPVDSHLVLIFYQLTIADLSQKHVFFGMTFIKRTFDYYIEKVRTTPAPSLLALVPMITTRILEETLSPHR